MSVLRASPVSLRQSLELVETLKRAGLDFVPMPVRNPEDKQRLLLESIALTQDLIRLAEGRDDEVESLGMYAGRAQVKYQGREYIVDLEEVVYEKETKTLRLIEPALTRIRNQFRKDTEGE